MRTDEVRCPLQNTWPGSAYLASQPRVPPHPPGHLVSRASSWSCDLTPKNPTCKLRLRVAQQWSHSPTLR